MKFSQNLLAEKLDISREHLAKIETAKRTVSLDLLIQIAEVLEIRVNELIDFNIVIDVFLIKRKILI